MEIEREPLGKGFDPAATPQFWVVLGSHSRTVRHILFGDTAEDMVQELCRAFLRRNQPTPIVTDHGSVRRAGRKGSQGDVER